MERSRKSGKFATLALFCEYTWQIATGAEQTTVEEILDNSITVATEISNWVPPAQINSHLVIKGDTELEYLQYNYGGDWP